MSQLLRTLLPAVEAAAGRRLRPRDVDAILLHNTGAIPPMRLNGHAAGGEPGFNVLVAERGRPIYFCKCRPAGDPALAHEAAIGTILAGDPATAPHVPVSSFVPGEIIDVLVVQRLPGRPYHELLVRQPENEWPASVEYVVSVVERMATRVGAALPALCGQSALRFAEEARWALDALAEQGLSGDRIAIITATLERGGSTAPQLQHGDLWPPNVLVDGSSWYVLDLELFGRVRTPLYDLLHMLHICSEVRHPESETGKTWVERVIRGAPTEAGVLGVLRRAADRQGLAAPSALAALVYYVVDMTARVKARGAWTADWRQYVALVERLADLITEGAAETPFGLRSAENRRNR